MSDDARRLVRDIVLFDRLHVERAKLWRLFRMGVDRYRFTAERVQTEERIPGKRGKRVEWHTYFERLDVVSWHPVPGTLEKIGVRDTRNEAALDCYRAAMRLERPVRRTPSRRKPRARRRQYSDE